MCSVIIHINTLKHSHITPFSCFISCKPGERGTDGMNSKVIITQYKQTFSCSYHEKTQKTNTGGLNYRKAKKNPKCTLCLSRHCQDINATTKLSVKYFILRVIF